MANEPGFRSLLRLSVAQSLSVEPTGASIRGERRIRWIEHALAPEAQELDEHPFRRDVSALALCIEGGGLRGPPRPPGLRPDEAEDTLQWAARALLTAAVNDAHYGKSRRSTRP